MKKQLNVVYIDDEKELLEIFTDFFSSEDVLVKTFSNSTKGLDYINENPVDIVFLDFRMPGANGDLVASNISKDIPIVLMTGDQSFELSYKFHKILEKPFDEDDIISIFNDLR